MATVELPQNLLSTVEAARYLGLSVHTVRADVSTRRHRFPLVRIGARNLYPRAELDKFIKAHTVISLPNATMQ